MNWATIIHNPKCSHCGLRKRLSRDRRWKGPFCPNCAASLPDVLHWHVETALTNLWFLRWWRLASAWLRRDEVHQRHIRFR